MLMGLGCQILFPLFYYYLSENGNKVMNKKVEYRITINDFRFKNNLN